MLAQLKKQNGYLTVEVTLVFTLILFSLMVIIFLGIFLYQQTALQSSVQMIASQGAAMYASGSTELTTAERPLASYKNQDPYVNFIDSPAKTAAVNSISTAIAVASNQNEIRKGANELSGAIFKRDFISAKVIVSAARDYTMPIVSAANTFGLVSPLKVNAAAAAPVTNPVEVIRMTDICTDALMYFETSRTVIEKLVFYQGKVAGFIQGLDISE